jgi:hypothetical protein
MKFKRIICGFVGHKPFQINEEKAQAQKAIQQARTQLGELRQEIQKIKAQLPTPPAGGPSVGTMVSYPTSATGHAIAATTTPSSAISTTYSAISTLYGTVSSSNLWYSSNAASSNADEIGAGLSGPRFNAGPFKTTMTVCARCHSVYWDCRPDGPTIATKEQLPELQPYLDWQERQAKEKRLRETNEGAEKLYRQYQVLLKLGSNE